MGLFGVEGSRFRMRREICEEESLGLVSAHLGPDSVLGSTAPGGLT